YENNSQWNAKVITGVVEAAGRDHIIISERSTGRRIILLMVNLDYVVFDAPLQYQYPGVFGNPPPTGR
ncbi:spore coat protein GerQ, partial [Clostridium perfringens]